MDPANERIAALRLAMNPRQRAFAELILQEYTATDAYKEVYDTDPNNPITHRTCVECGCRLLGHRKVRAYVEAVSASAIDDVIINRAEVIAALRDVALSGVTQGPGAGARVSACKIILDAMEPGGEKKTVILTGPDGKAIQTETKHSGGISPSLADDICKRLFGLTDDKPKG